MFGACFTEKPREWLDILTVFVGDKAGCSPKWPHLGPRFKRITVENGLKAFCDNKLNFMHDCWNTTFPCLCSRTHSHTHTGPEEKTAQLQQKQNGFLFQRTDGCQEYLLPQNDTLLINLNLRVAELTPRALLLYSDAKSDLWN